MANVLFKRGDTATITGTAITDGQLLYDTTTGRHYVDVGSTRKEVGKVVDTALSTTSTNAISNGAITSSIVNTTAEVSAITADYIPCGTKPVKELIQSLNTTNATVSTKADKTGTSQIKAIKTLNGSDPNAYSNASFLAENDGSTNGAGYGFHIPGRAAGCLFLDPNINTLCYIDNNGLKYKIDMTPL